MLGRFVACLLLGLLSAEKAGAADLRAVLDEVSARYRLPGAVLMVTGPDRSETVVRGFASLAARIPVTEQTRFHVASVGKILTAVAILQLADERKLALDASISPFLDERAARRLTHSEKSTIADLLAHTSGLPDCLRNASFSTPEHPGIAWNAADALALGRCRPPSTPGTFTYSNTNYILLGHILEKLEGEDLAKVLDRRILKPLGMSDSTAEVNPADPLLARGHRKATADGNRKDSSLLAWSSRLGDAPLTTTAADLDRFLRALFRPDSPLLSADMLAAMKAERGSNEDGGYGYGLELIQTDAGLRYGHNGRFGGFCAEAWYYPDKDTTIILLGNGDEHSPEDVMDLIEARLFPQPG